jgi:hypothetical protein
MPSFSYIGTDIKIMNSRIMYIELKTNLEGHTDRGPACIGRVYFNKSGRTLTYKGKKFQRCRGSDFNYFEIETKDGYWISGPKKNGEDRFTWARKTPVNIDEDVREEYWVQIRNQSEKKNDTSNIY